MAGRTFHNGHAALTGGAAALALYGYRPWLLIAAAFAAGYVARGVVTTAGRFARFAAVNAFRNRREW